MIVTNNLTLGFKKPLVSQITLKISQGEFIGIFGPNGSGKSTFLRTILGLIKPLSGQLTVLSQIPPRQNKMIGYMPQSRAAPFHNHLTGKSLLQATVNGTRWGIPFLSEGAAHEISRVTSLVKAEKYITRPLHQLSGGERQRIFLAQALLGNPRLLLLDEPLSGLDPRYQETFIRLLSDIQKESHSTILFTAHDPNPLLSVMNRVLYFAKGKIVAGTIEQVITSEKLTALYETPIEVIHYKNRILVLGEEKSVYAEESHHD